MREQRLERPWRGLAAAWGLLLAPGLVYGQELLPPTGPVATAAAPHGGGGPLHRAPRHVKHTLHDKLIGYPEYFVEPPLGAPVQSTFAVMKSKAETHRFFLYRSDFVAGTTNLTEGGAQRLALMAQRASCHLGPMVIEATPEHPGLGEARRQVVLSNLASAGIVLGPERLLVGPTPYHGLNGQEAAIDYNLYLERAAFAPTPSNYIPPPRNPTIGTSAFGMGGR